MAHTQHWGEIKTEDIVPDISELIKKSMEKFCLSAFDTKTEEDEERIDHVILPPMDPLMLYTISLHKYYNKLSEIYQKQTEDSNWNTNNDIPPIPPIPEILMKSKKNALNFTVKEFTPFTLGYDVEVPELSDAVVRQILLKSVAIMLVHAGFENTTQSILDFLADVLADFLKRISVKLKTACDNNQNSVNFLKLTEKVLIDIGMDGVAGLHDYYQDRIVKHILTLHKRCRDLAENLRNPKGPVTKTSSNRMIPMKIKEVGESEDLTVLHVGSESEFSNIPNMENCFQLLNSLEASEQNLVEDDSSSLSAAMQ